MPIIGDQTKHFHSLSPQNRWAIRTIKSVAGAVSSILGRPSTTKWHHYLPLAEFAHNSWPNETTRSTPFEVMMGHNPRAKVIDTILSMPTVALRIDLWKQARKRANELILQAQSRWKKAKDKKVEFKIGDKVWLEGRNLKSD